MPTDREPGYIDRFPGTDDAKLDAALAWVRDVRARTSWTPPLIAPLGEFHTSGTRVIPPGLVLDYPHGHAGFRRAAQTSRCDWRHHGPDPMWTLADGQTFDFYMGGLAVESADGATFLDPRGRVGWTAVLRDLAFSGWRHVWGTPSSKCLNTLVVWDGFHNYNNARGTQVNLGGSDSRVATSRFALDVGGNPAFRRQFADAKAWLVNLDHQQKSDVVGLYVTAEGDANGLRVVNGPWDGRVTITDSVLEGRNARQPCTRTLLAVESGLVQADRLSINYARKPAAVDGGAPVVVSTGARLTLRDVSYARADGVDELVPLVHVRAGGRLRIEGAEGVGPFGDGTGGTWRDRRPRVTFERGATVLCPDQSVVVVPA